MIASTICPAVASGGEVGNGQELSQDFRDPALKPGSHAVTGKTPVYVLIRSKYAK
jgi:hypothetical protein